VTREICTSGSTRGEWVVLWYRPLSYSTKSAVRIARPRKNGLTRAGLLMEVARHSPGVLCRRNYSSLSRINKQPVPE
jgi:hypothetical protein